MSDLDVQVEGLARLNSNWDSHGGTPPTHEAIKTLCNIVFVPLPNGGIQVEIDDGDVYVETEIAPDGNIVYTMKFSKHKGK